MGGSTSTPLRLPRGIWRQRQQAGVNWEGLANDWRLVDAEVVGDELHIQEPKDEQRECGHADECEHNQDEARESVRREVSRATWLPPALCGRRGRFGFRLIVGHGLSLSPHC
jgi:hypothetical protein